MAMKLQVPWRCFWPEPCDGFILHCDARLFRYRFFTPQVHKHKLLKPFGDGWIGYVSARRVGKAGFHLSLQLASMLVLLVLASLALPMNMEARNHFFVASSFWQKILVFD